MAQQGGPPQQDERSWFGQLSIAAAIVGGVATFVVALLLLFSSKDWNLVGEDGADPLAWGLIFLMAGLSAFFGLLGFWARPETQTGPAPPPRETDDEVLDAVARWVRAADIVAKGTQIAGSFPGTLAKNLEREAADYDLAAKAELRQALGGVAQLEDDAQLPHDRKTAVSALKSALEGLGDGVPAAEVGAALTNARDVLEGVDHSAVARVILQLEQARLHAEARDAFRRVGAVVAGQETGL